MIVKVRVHDEDNLYNSFMQQETEEINLNMPIKYLKTKELLIEKRKFFDVPQHNRQSREAFTKSNTMISESTHVE